MKKLKVGQRIKVEFSDITINGTIIEVMKWVDPFSVLHKKGIDYKLESDETKEAYVISDANFKEFVRQDKINIL
jgi:hypothetical protein